MVSYQPKQPTFSQNSLGWQDNDDFYFSKIFQNFTTLLPSRKSPG